MLHALRTESTAPLRAAFGKSVRPLLALIVASAGCSSYKTPERGADMSVFTDSDIETILARQPTAAFPANIAVARVQAPGYRSHTARGYGKGKYSVVTLRDVEADEDFDRIADLSKVADVVQLNRLLLGDKLDSDKPLRQAAASLHADMLLLYTLDTTFYIQDPARPLTVISIGFSSHKDIRVATTASFVLIDVRTGYIYGAGEATARETQSASAWTDEDAVDLARLDTEREAFVNMLGDFQSLWRKISDSQPSHSTMSMDK